MVEISNSIPPLQSSYKNIISYFKTQKKACQRLASRAHDSIIQVKEAILMNKATSWSTRIIVSKLNPFWKISHADGHNLFCPVDRQVDPIRLTHKCGEMNRLIVCIKSNFQYPE